MSDRLDTAIRELVAAIRAEIAAASPPMPVRLLSVGEAARALAISRAALYGLLGRGLIQSHSIGRRRLISQSALDRFLNGESPPGKPK